LAGGFNQAGKTAEELAQGEGHAAVAALLEQAKMA
jgi:hypothetical protein